MTRTAIVTGAARGIGAAVAVRLARDGLNVAVVDLEESAGKRTVELIGETGRRAIALGADVARPAAVTRAVDEVAQRLGPPTVLVNNAGVVRDNLLYLMSVEDWDTVMDVHLRGTFLMSQAVAEHMAKLGWGRIVNVSSVAALGNVGQANYSAAKAGVQGLTKTLALELGPLNITVNAVAPGFVVTDMTAGLAARAGKDFAAFQHEAAARIPVRRVGQPEDIAHAVSFLAGEGASFVSGQVLDVAGGPVH